MGLKPSVQAVFRRFSKMMYRQAPDVSTGFCGLHYVNSKMEKGESMYIKYRIDYQYLPKGSSRPQADGKVVGIEATSDSGQTILPNVGDHVHIDNSMDGGERMMFTGKVRSRLFSYIRVSDGEIFCNVNIVVEETDDDWGKLIKE
jgi:hypothetical protein